jgi:hypothetical protein
MIAQDNGAAATPKIATGKEHRRRKRFECDGIAETLVIHPESLFRGKIRDISETGCYMMTKAWLNLERLTEVEIRFIVNGRHYHTYAQVMEVRPRKGIGLEFVFQNAETASSFKSLVEMVSAAAERKQKQTAMPA